jgi:hypothetical protein
MIGFGLTDYPSFGVYLHLDEGLLDEIVKIYELKPTDMGMDFTFGNKREYLN